MARTGYRPTFPVACWLLGAIAFVQLISMGFAVVMRSSASVAQSITEPAEISNSLAPIAPRSLEEILNSVEGGSVSADVAEPLRVTAKQGGTQIDYLKQYSPSVVPNDLQLPMIANPRVERLVKEARNLHLEGDMMNAILKLDEAERIDAKEVAVTYQKGLIFEEMSLFVKAADQYQKIQQLGVKGGVYFSLAAKKLTQGMDTIESRRNVISIGPSNTKKIRSAEGLKQANITISVLGRADTIINPDDVVLNIYVYDQVNGAGQGAIKRSNATSIIEQSWVDSVVDWKGIGNQETINIAYTIPQTQFNDNYLLGSREFYGYVVELLYKGEAVDQQASPRRLHSIHSRSLASPSGPFGSKELDTPSWMNGDSNSLLPRRGEPFNEPIVFPPLPSR